MNIYCDVDVLNSKYVLLKNWRHKEASEISICMLFFINSVNFRIPLI